MSLNSSPARLYVANRRAKPIVSTSGSSASRARRGPTGASPCRANWLRSRARAKCGQLALLAQVGLPQVAPRIRSRRSQNRPVSVVASRSSRSAPRSSSSVAIGEPIQVGAWTPLVMARISWSMTPAHVALAVIGMELADGVGATRQAQGEGGHVELRRVAVDAEAELEHLLDRDAAPIEQRPRHATDEVRIEPLVAGRHRRVDGEDAVAADRRPRLCRASSPAATCSRARSASRNAEWPSFRCQTAGVSRGPGSRGRRRCRGRAPGGGASRDRGRRGCW